MPVSTAATLPIDALFFLLYYIMSLTPVFKNIPAKDVQVWCVASLPRQESHRVNMHIFRVIGTVGDYAPLGDIFLYNSSVSISRQQPFQLNIISGAPEFITMVHTHPSVSQRADSSAMVEMYKLTNNQDLLIYNFYKYNNGTASDYVPLGIFVAYANAANASEAKYAEKLHSLMPMYNDVEINYRLVHKKYLVMAPVASLQITVLNNGSPVLRNVFRINNTPGYSLQGLYAGSNALTLSADIIKNTVFDASPPVHITANTASDIHQVAIPPPSQISVISGGELITAISPDYVETKPNYAMEGTELDVAINTTAPDYLEIPAETPIVVKPTPAIPAMPVIATKPAPAAPAAPAATYAPAAPEGFFSKYMIWIIVIVAVLAGVVVYKQFQKNNSNHQVDNISDDELIETID